MENADACFVQASVPLKRKEKKEDARSWEYLRNVKELGGIAEAYRP